MLTLQVDWNQLAKIEELQDYFESDFQGFQNLIERYIRKFEQFGEEELNKLAYLRVLEVTNGCTQWGFRRQDKQSLSVEDTRHCMKMVMGFIKNKRVDFPSRGTIVFSPKVESFIEEGRELYCDAFKKNVPGMKREYYASSTAQFIVYGRRNLELAMACVKQDYENLFSPYYIQRGQNYIAPYLACIS
ncbi:hypothetical protein IQ255_30850 [Pleurocapsales cyanobacterium LEGE 10410]|nr:hypothetical protein [Pleurocapsales cyanobacterium LEGE 10410]